MSWSWDDVRRWAEDYRGDASGFVKQLLAQAVDGDARAWDQLATLYQRVGAAGAAHRGEPAGPPHQHGT